MKEEVYALARVVELWTAQRRGRNDIIRVSDESCCARCVCSMRRSVRVSVRSSREINVECACLCRAVFLAEFYY